MIEAFQLVSPADTDSKIGDMKIWVSAEIIWRKYMMMSEEFAP
jgi:hypothetical protein